MKGLRIWSSPNLGSGLSKTGRRHQGQPLEATLRWDRWKIRCKISTNKILIMKETSKQSNLRLNCHLDISLGSQGTVKSSRLFSIGRWQPKHLELIRFWTKYTKLILECSLTLRWRALMPILRPLSHLNLTMINFHHLETSCILHSRLETITASTSWSVMVEWQEEQL